MKKMTVLLAAYQGSEWLEPQLRSLAAQDDGCFDVLWQDDGSADETAERLKEWSERDERFRAGREQGGHRGAIGNFWSLLGQTNADYTAFCDQDDVWYPERLSVCRRAMEEAQERYGAETPLLVHSDCRVMAADGTILHESFFAHQGWDASAVTLNRLLVQNNVTGCTVLINRPLRELALRYGRPERMTMHDWFLAATAAAWGKIIFVPQQLVNYRQHGSNVKGASGQDLVRRGFKALGAAEKGRERMRLTYAHARMLSECWGSDLPEDAARVLNGYLELEKQPRAARLLGYIRGDYMMQSTVTRCGQLLFG